MLHGASGGPSRASTSLRVGWLCSRRPIRSDAICPRGLSGSQLPRHLLHKAWSKDALSNGSVGLSQRSHRAMAPTMPQTTISSLLRDARIANSERPNDLVLRAERGAHDRALYRSRPVATTGYMPRTYHGSTKTVLVASLASLGRKWAEQRGG